MTPPGRLNLGLMVLAFFLYSAPLLAQNSLPPDIITSPDPIGGDQQVVIDRFVSAQVAKLLADNPQESKPARERLIGPTRHPNMTNNFMRAYGITVASKLKPGTEAEDPWVRINTHTVIASMKTPAVAEACLKGLNDPNPAVRYWATRAAANQKAGAFNANQQRKLIAILGKRLTAEQNPEMARQAYLALGQQTLPEAEAAILKALEARVDLQVTACKADLNDGLRADVEAIRKMVEKLTEEETVRKKDVRQQRKRLIQAAAKYLVLGAESLVTGKLSNGAPKQDLQPAVSELIRLSENQFNKAVTEVGFRGPDMNSLVKDKDKWVKLFNNVLEWVGSTDTGPGILTVKVKIPLKDLLICTRAEKKAAAEGG